MSFIPSNFRDQNTSSNTTTFLVFNPNDMQFGASSFHEDLDSSFLNLLNLKDNHSKRENEPKFYDDRNYIKNSDYSSNKNNFNSISNRNQEKNNPNINEKQMNDGREQFISLKGKEAGFLEDKNQQFKYDDLFSHKDNMRFYRNSDTQIKILNLNEKKPSENQNNDLFLKDKEYYSYKSYEEREKKFATVEFQHNFPKNSDESHKISNLNSNKVPETTPSEIDKFNERFNMLKDKNLLGITCSPGITEKKIDFPTVKGTIPTLNTQNSEKINVQNNKINMKSNPYDSPFIYASDCKQKNDLISTLDKNNESNGEKNIKNFRTNSFQDCNFQNKDFPAKTMANLNLPTENYKLYYPDPIKPPKNPYEPNYESTDFFSKKMASTHFSVEREKKSQNVVPFVSPPKIVSHPVNIKKKSNFEPLFLAKERIENFHGYESNGEELNLFRKPENVEKNAYQIRDIKPPVIERKQPIIFPKQNDPQILKRTQVGSPRETDSKHEHDNRQKNQADPINYSSKIENVSTTIKEIDDLLDKLAPIRKYYETRKSTKAEISNQTSTSSGTCQKNVMNSEEIDSFSKEKMQIRQNESFSKEKNNFLQKVIAKLERSMYNRYRDLPKLIFSITNFFKNVLNNSSDRRTMSADIKEIEVLLNEIMLTFDNSDFLKADWLICCRGVNICKEKLKILKMSNLSGSFSREINTSLILSNELEKLDAIDSFTMLEGYDLEN